MKCAPMQTPYRPIWGEAIKANQAMLHDRDAGNRQFRRLFELHPDDGMIFYERAEAFEHLGLLDEAEADYKHAERFLTSPHWKDVARLAVVRVDRRRTKAGVPSCGVLQWDLFHRAHGVREIPHEIRKRALSAISRAASEPESAAGELRWCIEQIVNKIESNAGISKGRRDLDKRIEALRKSKRIPQSLAARMDCVRWSGNAGLHGPMSAAKIDWVRPVTAFVTVMEWAGAEVWPNA